MKTDKSEQLGLSIGEVFRSWRTKADERLLPLGLSQAKWRAMFYLSLRPDGIIQKELASLICIEGPTLVRLLDRLASDGWVQRKSSKQDRRCKTVHLTEKAQPTIAKIRKVVAQLRQEIFFGVKDEDLETSLRVMRHIKKRIDSL
jgi:MarR family transcriptional regulator for hemolysin